MSDRNPMPSSLDSGATLREVIEGGYWYLPADISNAILKVIDERDRYAEALRVGSGGSK